MTLQNQLRLGLFERPTALILYRHKLSWEDGKGHLRIWIADRLFISQMRHLPDDTFEFVYSYRRAYDLNLVLEPPVGTFEHMAYLQWEGGGMSRAFYNPVAGVVGGHAFVSPPLRAHEYLNEPAPYIGGGGAVSVGHPFVVDLHFVAACVWQSLAALGVHGADQQTIANCILTELGEAQRRNGF